MTSLYDVAAQSLIDRGHALLRDEALLMPMVRAALLEAENFFGQGDTAKLLAATTTRLEGYRPIGNEFSETPEQPDLCESFSVWGWNAGDTDVRAWSARNRLHAAMTPALSGFANVANGVLEALRRSLNPVGQELDASEASYLQINHYRPRDFEREFLQETHEDGHVLTIHKATGSGLEIRSGGQFTAMKAADDEFLLLPGSLLTLMTGGLVPPLFHRVRNDHTSVIRQSFLYFVNPSMVEETQPWIESDINRGISIRATALSCVGAR